MTENIDKRAGTRKPWMKIIGMLSFFLLYVFTNRLQVQPQWQHCLLLSPSIPHHNTTTTRQQGMFHMSRCTLALHSLSHLLPVDTTMTWQWFVLYMSSYTHHALCHLLPHIAAMSHNNHCSFKNITYSFLVQAHFLYIWYTTHTINNKMTHNLAQDHVHNKVRGQCHMTFLPCFTPVFCYSDQSWPLLLLSANSWSRP